MHFHRLFLLCVFILAVFSIAPQPAAAHVSVSVDVQTESAASQLQPAQSSGGEAQLDQAVGSATPPRGRTAKSRRSGSPASARCHPEDFDCLSDHLAEPDDQWVPDNVWLNMPMDRNQNRIIVGTYRSNTVLDRLSRAFPDIANQFKSEIATDANGAQLARVYIMGASATNENCRRIKTFDSGALCYIDGQNQGQSQAQGQTKSPSSESSVSDSVREARLRIATIAHSRALAKSIQRCGQYVRIAIQQGLRSPKWIYTRSASDFGPSLLHVGFRPIPANGRSTNADLAAAEPGDVCIIRRFGSHVHGHAVIKTLTGWASDFRQVRANPYRQNPPHFTLYRYYGN